MNDILQIKFNGFCSLFEDDIKICSIRGPPMQSDIDALYSWIKHQVEQNVSE